ncbi:hypothetical protein BURMUCGD1_5167 [Burkholderia multivorans CGD1]|nr:hypothetical protein BURMUCGD1_5167 [Burkholderia multivorans CGD1]
MLISARRLVGLVSGCVDWSRIVLPRRVRRTTRRPCRVAPPYK